MRYASILHSKNYLCLHQVGTFAALTMEVAPRASQASREGGVVWQAGKT
jgi:hypothetical protein